MKCSQLINANTSPPHGAAKEPYGWRLINFLCLRVNFKIINVALITLNISCPIHGIRPHILGFKILL